MLQGDPRISPPQITIRGKSINDYLPMELLRDIFLYSIESNQVKSGHLASVCRFWNSVIITISHLWSTLRVEAYTKRERVAIWLQRAYPKKVVIDTQRYGHVVTSIPLAPFDALQDALANTSQWHELTISSFLPDHVACLLAIQGLMPMNLLRTLNVAAGCTKSPSFTHLLDLVPPEVPLSELRLHS